MTRMRRAAFVPAIVALCAMFFVQAAVAFAKCEMQEGAPAMAMQMAMPDCPEAQVDAALGWAHCKVQDQAAGTYQPKVPDLSLSLALPLRAPQVHAPAKHVIARTPQAAVGPPPRIRFQSFLL